MLLPSLAVAVVGRSIRVGGLPFVPYGFYSNGVHDASEWRQAATAYHNASALPGLGSQQVMVSELALPSAEALHDGLFAKEPIEWNRIGVFQDISLRLLADSILARGCRDSVIEEQRVRGEIVLAGMSPTIVAAEGDVLELEMQAGRLPSR